MLTWLYVPGDRPDRFAKAVASGADTVILDLEDAVHPARKDYARDAVVEFCASPHEVPLQVRVNADSADDDLAALVGLDVEVRVPKVSSADEVVRVAASGMRLHLLIESALGLERAYEIAVASPSVASISLGDSDLRSDLGLRAGEAGLAYARGRIVQAARAAGLPPPPMSAWTDVRDLDGLASSCRLGLDLGLLGRAAIHPIQLPVIVEAFRPTAVEVQRATALLDALAAADTDARGGVLLADGRFADPAMLGAARQILTLSRRYPPLP